MFVTLCFSPIKVQNIYETTNFYEQNLIPNWGIKLTPAPGLYKDQICCGQKEQILFGQKGQNYMAFPGGNNSAAASSFAKV